MHSTYNKRKSVVAERFIRTLKKKAVQENAPSTKKLCGCQYKEVNKALSEQFVLQFARICLQMGQ